MIGRGIDSLVNLGEQLSFMAKSMWDMIFATRHTGEIARLISEITLGSGAKLTVNANGGTDEINVNVN